MVPKATFALLVCLGALSPFALAQPAEPLTFDDAQSLLRTYCLACHQGEAAVAGFDLTQFETLESVHERPREWEKALGRIRRLEMPPKGAPEPSLGERERLASWLENTLHTAACAGGAAPGPAPIRRLNRDEYTATMRDLLGIQINAGQALPADGAGGEGFDNAAETLFLSPVHAEKYLEAARQALDYAAKDPRSRKFFLRAEPGEDLSPEQAARLTLEAFLPRAFRRPVSETELERYLELFRQLKAEGGTYDESILFALQGVLVSPHFLFHVEAPNLDPEPRPVGDFELANRLSYFLWGTMPDASLFSMANSGGLRDPALVEEQALCMLSSRKVRVFAERFIEQWLGTRELGRDIQPDLDLFPAYADEELQGSIRYEPILFFEEILTNDLSLLNLIDSDFSVINKTMQEHYELPEFDGLRRQPKRVELPPNSHRGGVLTMAATLAASSYPQRTSPVLRGKWVLENILGAPPPPPPPNVPELEEAHEGEVSKTVRERLEQHRQNPVCASCHDRIDPIGFGLENYDVLGRWRNEDAGKPIDSRGELIDGRSFEGPEELKQVLLEQRDEFIRHLTSKMLGYALGRGLTAGDYCTVDRIVERLEQENYSAQTLVTEIVLSTPFLYKPAGEVAVESTE